MQKSVGLLEERCRRERRQGFVNPVKSDQVGSRLGFDGDTGAVKESNHLEASTGPSGDRAGGCWCFIGH